MKRLVLAMSVAALSTGCAAADWFSAGSGSQPAPASMLTRADDLLRQGQPMAARDLYVRIVAEPERDPDHARALYRLARLYADPTGGLRDYRAAHLTFERLLAEHPKGEWEQDARAWNAVLCELAAREVELEARDGELGVREAEVARLKSEAARLGADLQRLKAIDLRLERRR